MLSELSQIEKDKYWYTTSFICGNKNNNKLTNITTKKETDTDTVNKLVVMGAFDKICKTVVVEWKIQGTGCKIGSMICCAT